MPIVYPIARRNEIKAALDKHMKESRIRATELSRHINSRIAHYSSAVDEKDINRACLSPSAIRRFLKRDLKSDKVGSHKVETLEAYLIDEGLLSPSGQRQKVPAVASGIFPALLQFLKIDAVAVSPLVQAITGDWAFYVYSEHSRNRVVRGAIKFDVKGSDCVADELQTRILTSRRLIREEQAGYFVVQDNSLIVLLLNKRRPLTKFYILHIVSHTDNEPQKEVMTGALVAVGDSKDVFTGVVYMERQPLAREETTMLTRPEVRPDILDVLDSREWMSP